MSLLSAPVCGQERGRPLDLRSYGFDIPPGVVSAPAFSRVTTLDQQGRAVVARVEVNVGRFHLVLLPDGQLVARSFDKAEPTERPFRPVSMDQLESDLKQGPLSQFRSLRTRHYLFIYGTSDAFARDTSRILEQMLPGAVGYARLRGIEVQEPELPLVVLMFKNDDQFQAYRRMPAGIIAYYHTLTNHVVLYEESKLAGLKPELARQQTINTIAHEGVHQILHNIGFQRRLSAWPMWISEGMAEFMAPTAVGERSRWKGVGQVNDLRMFELETFLKSLAGDEPDGEWIGSTVTAARLTSTGYASAWALTHYLAKTRKPQFNTYLQQLHKLGPLEGGFEIMSDGTIPKHLELFRDVFQTDVPELEKRLAVYLEKLPYKNPFADWPHVAVLIAHHDGTRVSRQANIFHDSRLAQQWRDKTVQAIEGANAINTKTLIRPFANRLQAQQFATRWLKMP